MANRRFEMYKYRQIIVRMRLGESDRTLANTGLIGRKKAKALRDIAQQKGWLELSKPLPDDAALAEVLGQRCSRRPAASLVVPYQKEVKAWWQQGIQGTTIHQALVRKYG